MKKILLAIFTLFIGIGFVQAANILEFNENDGKLYYDTDALNKDAFMVHTDMVPGKGYEDILTIENNSNNTYKLYMKAIEREQSELADELLDNIIMKVYLDDELIYDGKARGLDYSNSGVNLQDSIYIGEYDPSKVQELRVETMLDSSYDNINNSDLSYIDWEFYASFGEEVLPINPNTGDYKITYFIKISICCLFIILLILIFYSIHRKIENKKLIN